jgi:competence protein ComEC
VIVCGLLVFVLRALRISRILWVFFLAPLLAAYTVATGCEPSATRACIMAVAYFTAPCLGRRTDVLSALALAALIILAWSPAQVCAAGFLCSFVVVGGLVVLCPLLERPLRPLWSPDPLRAQPERWAARLLRAGGRGTAGLLALNAAAWLSSAPLTAYFFGRFTPVALLSNFVVIPLAFAAVLAGCLAVVLGACLAPAADLFNHANLLLARVLMAAAERLLRLPGGSIAVGPPPAWAVLGCYGLLAVWPLWAAAKRVDSQPPE